MTKEDPQPVDTLEFWQERIYKTIATGGMLHQIIWDDSYDLWRWMQTEYAKILLKHIQRNQSVLDAGCGYGALLSCFQEVNLNVNYLGVDFSPDLIRLARHRYPGNRFECLSLYDLPYENSSFDWVIIRSVSGMLMENLGDDSWPPMHEELRRVGKNLLIGGYPEFIDDCIPYEIERT